MSTRPLLIFPQPERAPRKKKGGGPSDVHFPSHRKQVQRLAPKFDTLRRTFETQRAQLRPDPGLEPERVLVLETVDGVDEFVKAIRKTPGMEWLGEWDEEAIASDDDFYLKSHPEEPVGGRLYLVTLNQRALAELLSLWNRYRRDPTEQFARGLNKWRNIFARLRDIRPWNERDRLDRNLVRLWEEELSAPHRENVHFKVELWFSGSENKRRLNQALVEQLVREQGGRVSAQAIIPEIAFHAVAGILPPQAARRLIALEQTQLVLCDQIMFFRPLGQSAVPYPEGEPLPGPSGERQPRRPELREPVVALLDGLPAVNHQLLIDRITLDDPDGWSQQYTAQDPVHGTMMASLIAHGDLSNNERSIPTPIYVRPIFTPDRRGWRSTPVECIPKGVIPEDLIQRAIGRMFSVEGGMEPVAPSVRIVSLAIGDPFVLFERTVSPFARLLDWLAWKYQVLFLVSAGNRVEDIQLDIARGTLRTLTPDQLQQATLRAIELDGFNRRLLCPAEAINVLTVGATHSDSSTIGPLGSRINPLTSPDLPSPISALGLGYRRSVKPDLLLTGGR